MLLCAHYSCHTCGARECSGSATQSQCVQHGLRASCDVFVTSTGASSAISERSSRSAHDERPSGARRKYVPATWHHCPYHIHTRVARAGARCVSCRERV
eukprot:4690152-Prymnesium_polylepis.1